MELTDIAEMRDSRISWGGNKALNSCLDNSCQLLPAEYGQITYAIHLKYAMVVYNLLVEPMVLKFNGRIFYSNRKLTLSQHWIRIDELTLYIISWNNE